MDENFKFFGTHFDAALKQLKPRWKRVVASTDAAIGEALGKLYVADNFPPESKARALELVKNSKRRWLTESSRCEWMDDATKQEALKKLAAMTVKIGYPDKWRDYSTLKIDRGPYVLNAMRGERSKSNRAAEEDRQTGRSHRMGHDASDGQRVLQSEQERNRVSRREFCSRHFSTPRRTMRLTTAESARSLATK